MYQPTAEESLCRIPRERMKMRLVEVPETRTPRPRTGSRHRLPPEAINVVLVQEFRRS